MTLLITGGSGFIGSNSIQAWLGGTDEPIVNLDAMRHGAHPRNVDAFAGNSRYAFVQGDICDGALVSELLGRYRPRALLHFAAESHVDRSITGPENFIQTNLMGTFRLLEAARTYRGSLSSDEARSFRLLHVSTDEVYGALGLTDPPFTETSRIAPNSPYSASKAGSDHLARAYFHTYGIPVITTNCTNNYGPRQFPEKFIPVVIEAALASRPIPIYGRGDNVRDWIHVQDHCAALRLILERGEPGETYNVSAECEKRNIDLAQTICDLVDAMRPDPGRRSRRELLTFVSDRPGHDFRYATSAAHLRSRLGWHPETPFEQGLRDTVRWYVENRDWVALAHDLLRNPALGRRP